MYNNSSNALRVIEPATQETPIKRKPTARKPYGGSLSMEKTVKLRKDLRMEAAMLRSVAKTIMLLGLIGGCALCGLNTVVSDIFGEAGAWVMWGAGLIFALMNQFLAICLLSVSQRVTEVSTKIGKGVH